MADGVWNQANVGLDSAVVLSWGRMGSAGKGHQGPRGGGVTGLCALVRTHLNVTLGACAFDCR